MKTRPQSNGKTSFVCPSAGQAGAASEMKVSVLTVFTSGRFPAFLNWTCSRTYLNVGKSPRVLEQVLQNAKHFAFFSAEVVQKL
ncbi:MAG: hypothetical protein LBD86_07100, partial [Spirochaetaceae bacterium]|nr:hypothetical protein [Spirochaetaceae bacterium]